MRSGVPGRGRLLASTHGRLCACREPADAWIRPSTAWEGTIMTADVGNSYPGAPAAGHSGLARTGMALFGIAAVGVGIFLLLNPFAAVRTLALLLGLSLVIGGCLEIAAGWESGRRASAILLGAVLIVGGLLAA